MEKAEDMAVNVEMDIDDLTVSTEDGFTARWIGLHQVYGCGCTVERCTARTALYRTVLGQHGHHYSILHENRCSM